jgi:hypothetical protein
MQKNSRTYSLTERIMAWQRVWNAIFGLGFQIGVMSSHAVEQRDDHEFIPQLTIWALSETSLSVTGPSG